MPKSLKEADGAGNYPPQGEFKLWMDSLPSSNFLVNRSGIVLYSTSKSHYNLGYTPKQILGRNIADFIYSEDLGPFIATLEQATLEPGKSVTLETRVIHADSSVRWVDDTITNLENTKLAALAVNWRDITKRKTIEEQRDSFPGIVAHEVNNRLAAMKAHLLILQRNAAKINPATVIYGDLTSMYSEGLSRLDHEINHTHLLLETLMTRSSILSGKLELKRTEVDLAQLVIMSVSDIEKVAGAEHHIEVDLPEKPVKLDADPVRLEQVLLNILSNAIKYSPRDRSEVNVKFITNAQQVEIAVTDHGQGIPKSVLDKLFNQYYTGAVKNDGHGFGLFVCKEIIEAHGGKIWAESGGENMGSTFHLTLPL